MTWTWHDDDPATALSAQNMQNHVELRLRALEVAGGGGVTLGAMVRRSDDSSTMDDLLVNDVPVPALDPTKARIVYLNVTNNTGAPVNTSIRDYDTGYPRDATTLAPGASCVLSMWMAPGTDLEFYGAPDAEVGVFFERSIS